jgi:hypothetical protein
MIWRNSFVAHFRFVCKHSYIHLLHIVILTLIELFNLTFLKNIYVEGLRCQDIPQMSCSNPKPFKIVLVYKYDLGVIMAKHHYFKIKCCCMHFNFMCMCSQWYFNVSISFGLVKLSLFLNFRRSYFILFNSLCNVMYVSILPNVSNET